MMDFIIGERVEVLWHGLGWLPGIFEGYTASLEGEEKPRCDVRMDNGFGCGYPYFHPDCVRAVEVHQCSQ